MQTKYLLVRTRNYFIVDDLDGAWFVGRGSERENDEKVDWFTSASMKIKMSHSQFKSSRQSTCKLREQLVLKWERGGERESMGTGNNIPTTPHPLPSTP